METAASVIAFVTLTLATVKSCRDLLSAVKDGPEKLNHVTTAISTLVSAFEQIENEPQLATLLSSTSLRKVTENCKADFERFKVRLEKIKILPAERRAGKLWKRLKLAFDEKDLPWMLAVVNGHVDAITMELNIIQFRTVDRVEESTSRILAQQETYSLLIEEQLTTLGAVRNHASDAAEHGALIRDAVVALTQKMMSMSSASREQASTMSETLRRIEEELAKSKARPATELTGSPSAETSILSTSSGHKACGGADSALRQSISRLGDLVTNVDCTMESGDAMDIIDDLDTLLRTAAKWNRDVESTSHTYPAQQGKPGLDINELRGHFLRSKSVQLNKALAHTTVPGFSITGRKHSYAEYKGSGGILRIQRRSRIWDRGSSQRDNFSDETNIATWIPGSLENRISITISYYERDVAGALSSLPPNLVVSPVLDFDHPVFNTVQYGQVDDLRRLLTEKKAWLRARDPYGASLLHYAAANLDVLGFLISHGADVDDLAHCYGVTELDGYLESPLQLSVLENVDNSACFQRLLAAGADPFLLARGISDGSSQGSAITEVATMTNYKYMKAAADEIANTCDAFGLLAAGPELVHYSTWNCEWGNIRILVNLGVDINGKDANGNNCLFTLLEKSASRSNLYPLGGRDGFLNSAKFLIESGIDLAPNADGLTPGHYAYHLALRSDYSSYIGDSWDLALALCGLNVAEARIGHPRVGRYKEMDHVILQYTLDMFKEMWDGHESLCPYYEEAVADSAVHDNRTTDWPQFCTDETCPYYDEMREGAAHWVSDDAFSSESDDSSEDGGVTIDSKPLDASEDSELPQGRL